MVEKRFGKLGMPDIERFENYLPTAFNSELTLLQKVNKIIFDLIETNKLTNEMVEYLNNFVETFDEKLYGTVDDVLNEWLENDKLAKFMRDLINEEVIEARTDYLGKKYVNLKERLDSEKADVVEVNAQLAQKATKQDLNNAVANISDGTPLFVDNVEGMIDVSRVYVNLTDGFIYRHDGSSFVSTGRLYQATGLGDGAVTPEKTDFFTVGKNLFNKNTVDKNRRVDMNNGNLLVVSGVSTSDFISIESNTDYHRNFTDAYVFYDSEYSYIKGYSSASFNKVIQTPDNARFIKLSLNSNKLNVFQFEKGREETHYEGYHRRIKEDVSISDKSIPYITPSKTTFFEERAKGKNLFNKDNIQKEYIVNEVGVLEPSFQGNFDSSGFIYVENMGKVYVSAKSHTYAITRAYAFYDENHNFLSYGVKVTEDSNVTIDIPSHAVYMVLSFSRDTTNLQVEEHSFTSYEPFEGRFVLENRYIPYKFSEIEASFNNYWYGKKSAWNGDSITQGYLSGGDPYPYKVGRNLGMEVENMALGGSSITAVEYPNLLNTEDGDYESGKIILNDGSIVDDEHYNLSGYLDISPYKNTENHQNVFLISKTKLPKGIKSYATYGANKNLINAYGDLSEEFQENQPFISVDNSVHFVRIAIPSDMTDAEIRYTRRYPLVWRYQSMSDVADLIYIAGGTNDWSYHVKLGTFEDRTPFTFYGALHLLCEGLQNKYVGKNIVFATPITRFEKGEIKNGRTQQVFVDAILEVCGWYSIPVLDMWRESGLDAMNPKHLAELFGGDTGGHPNNSGHEVMARRVTGYLNQLA